LLNERPTFIYLMKEKENKEVFEKIAIKDLI